MSFFDDNPTLSKVALAAGVLYLAHASGMLRTRVSHRRTISAHAARFKDARNKVDAERKAYRKALAHYHVEHAKFLEGKGNSIDVGAAKEKVHNALERWIGAYGVINSLADVSSSAQRAKVQGIYTELVRAEKESPPGISIALPGLAKA